MNYIKLVNQFWQVRRSTRITNLQADLYFFLLQECNERAWENPFQCSNIAIMAGISVAMSSLQDARKKLVEHGLITMEPGQKNISHPTYFIIQSIAVNRHRNRYTSGNESGNGSAISSEHNRVNENGDGKHKQNNSAGHGPAPAKKKKSPDQTTEHWPRIVNDWNNFYEQKFEIPPTFNPQAMQNLKKIITGLKKIATTAEKPLEWTEDNAARIFDKFLKNAYQDKWLKANFLLKNLYSNFDKIVTPKNDGQQQRGGGPGQGGAGATINDLQQLKRSPDPEPGSTAGQQ